MTDSENRYNPVDAIVTAPEGETEDEARRRVARALMTMWSTRGDAGMCTNLLALAKGPREYKSRVEQLEGRRVD